MTIERTNPSKTHDKTTSSTEHNQTTRTHDLPYLPTFTQHSANIPAHPTPPLNSYEKIEHVCVPMSAMLSALEEKAQVLRAAVESSHIDEATALLAQLKVRALISLATPSNNTHIFISY